VILCGSHQCLVLWQLSDSLTAGARGLQIILKGSFWENLEQPGVTQKYNQLNKKNSVCSTQRNCYNKASIQHVQFYDAKQTKKNKIYIKLCK